MASLAFSIAVSKSATACSSSFFLSSAKSNSSAQYSFFASSSACSTSSVATMSSIILMTFSNPTFFPSDTTLSQPTHATSQTTTQLPQSTTNLPHVHVLYVVYMAFYVICHILNSCMPNWQQLAMEGAVTASLPDDGHDGQKTACRLRGQTEYLI